MANWYTACSNITQNPILRTYVHIKSQFRMEPYLNEVKNPRYRNAIAKLRASSHTLEIERGRHTKPKTPIEERLCKHCKVIDDEKHFVLHCSLYLSERLNMLCNVQALYPEYHHLSESDRFIFLMTSSDPQILKWIGKFLYHAFSKKGIIDMERMSQT